MIGACPRYRTTCSSSPTRTASRPSSTTGAAAASTYPAPSVDAVLAAMEVDVADPAAALAGTARTSAWRRMLPPCVVVGAGRRSGRSPCTSTTARPSRSGSTWRPAGGATGSRQVDHWVRARASVDGRPIGEATFAVPADLPLGYHRLARPVRRHRGRDAADRHARLARAARAAAATAGRGASPPSSTACARAQSWGVGDLVDLTDLAVWSGAELGADFVLVNPLHAAEPVAPLEPSPYLPTSRRFFNPLYLRVERIPEYADAAGRRTGHRRRARRRRARPARRRRRDRPRHRVDGEAGRAADRARRAAQRRPRARPGGVPPPARRRAAATSRPGARSPQRARQRLPRLARGAAGRLAPRRSRSSPPRTATRSTSRRWLQWVSTSSSQHAQAKAVGAGMALGTMHDLAVGVHPGGADAWRLRSTYASGIQVGAPPDPFNQIGQNWSQPPWRPDRLEELGYAPFRDLIARRAAARRRGAGRPHHRAVPAVVDPGGPAADRGHLRPLRPRGDDRRARARGAAGRRGRRRRGPRRGRAVGPRLPAVARHPRHVDPVVRARRRAATRCPPSGGASSAWPRSPPTTCRRPPATWPATTSGCATGSACSTRALEEELAADDAERRVVAGRAAPARAARPRTPTPRRPCWRCTAT